MASESEMPEWAKALLPALARSRRAWESDPAEQMRLLRAACQKAADDMTARIEKLKGA